MKSEPPNKLNRDTIPAQAYTCPYCGHERPDCEKLSRPTPLEKTLLEAIEKFAESGV